MTRVLLACCVLILCSQAVAGDGDASDWPTAPQSAARAKAAFERGDADALRTIAADKQVEPWLVADVLCQAGTHDAAEAFARAATGPDAERLPAYVKAQRAKPDDRAARQALDKSLAALKAGDPDAAGRVIQSVTPDPDTVVGIRLMRGRALTQHAPHSAEEHEALRGAAAAAERLGWLHWASRIHYDLGFRAYRRFAPRVALAAYTEALRLHEMRGDRYHVATTIHNLGNVHGHLGQDDEARTMYERALALRREQGDRTGIAASLIDLGNLLARTQGPDAALPMLEEGLRMAQEVGQFRWASNALEGLGIVRTDLGELDEALKAHELALRLRRSLGDPLAIASSLQNLGDLRQKQGKWFEARKTYQQALDVRMGLGDGRGAALLLHRLGRLHAGQGELQRAREHFLRAMPALEKLRTHESLAALLTDLGELQLRLRRHDAAQQSFERATRLAASLHARNVVARAHAGLAQVHFTLKRFKKALAAAGNASVEAEAHAARAPLDAWFQVDVQAAFVVGIRAALQLKDNETLAWFLERERAQELLLQLSAREAVSLTVLPKALATSRRTADARLLAAHKAYDLAKISSKRTEIRSRRDALSKAEALLLRVETQVKREALRSMSVLAPRPASMETLQASLQPGQALVLYGRAEAEVVALVLTAKGARAVRLGSVFQESPALETRCGPSDEVATWIASMRLKLVTPLMLGKDITTVLVSPVGWLCDVPFGALFDRPVAMTPSGTVHVFLSKGPPPPSAGVLAVGDPTHEPSSRLTPLPATRTEANAIGDEVLLGADATETKLAAKLAKRERWRVIHLACHGLWNERRPRLTSLALTPDATSNGRLTVLEIERMRVSADLVTLTATNSARSKLDPAHGRVGLVQAFLLAHASRVIGSLWCVDDEATHVLMLKFYEHWRGTAKDGVQGLGAAAALRQAQAFVRGHDKWKHPYYWGAWVLWGLPD